MSYGALVTVATEDARRGGAVDMGLPLGIAAVVGVVAGAVFPLRTSLAFAPGEQVAPRAVLSTVHAGAGRALPAGLDTACGRSGTGSTRPAHINSPLPG